MIFIFVVMISLFLKLTSGLNDSVGKETTLKSEKRNINSKTT